MDIFEAIRSRHSYRGKYRDVPVPREDLIKIMQAGLDAPSGCNKQTTSLIAVDDPEVLARLHAVIDPPIGVTAPAAICVLTQRINAYRDKCFAIQDYSAAIENMLLATVALGYQSCWYEGHITDDDRICDRMAEILNVPAGYDLVCFMPIGVAENDPRGPRKKSLEERAWFNSFPGERLEEGKRPEEERKAMIRKATQEDLSRIAEILVFVKRMNYRSIFHDDAFSFGVYQVLRVAKEYADPSILDHMFVYDDGIVKGLVHIEGNEIVELYVDHFFQNEGIGAALIEFAKANFPVTFLWALEKNTKAIRFYEAHGFHLTDVRKLEEGTPQYLVMLSSEDPAASGTTPSL